MTISYRLMWYTNTIKYVIVKISMKNILNSLLYAELSSNWYIWDDPPPCSKYYNSSNSYDMNTVLVLTYRGNLLE